MRDLPRGTQVAGRRRPIVFAYGAITLYGSPFLTASTNDRFFDFARTLQGPEISSYNPSSETAATYLAEPVWAIPISLATTPGIISFPPATELFQFADLPHAGLFCSACCDWALPQPGFPIRTPPDQSMLAAPRGISLPTASFIGSWRQGIHLVPCVA